MANMSSTYLTQRAISQGGFVKMRSSIFYIVISAIATDIGDPMGVPSDC